MIINGNTEHIQCCYVTAALIAQFGVQTSTNIENRFL